MTLQFDRITITGDPGSGKSTFAKGVASRTGYELITTGNMFRALAAKKGISLTELNRLAEEQKEIDREVDDYIISLNDAQKNLVLDSRMAWHFIKDAFRIRLAVDPGVAAERIFSDTDQSRDFERFKDIEEAKTEIEARRASEIERYQSLYGVNISDDRNFDLIINTSRRSPQGVLEEFDRAFERYKRQKAEAGA